MPIQGSIDKARGVATTTVVDGGTTYITYHETHVVKFTDKTITLNSGGFWSQTTKRRMNQAANEHNLGFEVLQKNGDWIIKRGDLEIPFEYEEVRFRR